MTTSLEQLRREIDQLDDQILRILNRRAELAVEIGKIKRANGDALHVPAREREILQRLISQNRGPLSSKAIEQIYREIMAASLAMEQKD